MPGFPRKECGESPRTRAKPGDTKSNAKSGRAGSWGKVLLTSTEEATMMELLDPPGLTFP